MGYKQIVFPLFVLWLTVCAAPCVAQGDKSVCDALAKDFDRGNRLIALTLADGLTDNSAPRATLRKIETGNHLAVNNMTLMLMINARCPLPKRADTSQQYYNEALKCQSARFRGATSSVECDIDKWSGSQATIP